jgi:hypothetical protein
VFSSRKKPKREKKKVFLIGSFFFLLFFHEKIFVDGGSFWGHNSKITQHIKNHKSSSSCDFFLTSS